MDNTYRRLARIEKELFGFVGLPEDNCKHEWKNLDTHGSYYTYKQCIKCKKEVQT